MPSTDAGKTTEAQTVASLSEELRNRFPDTPSEKINKAVAEVHHEFDGQPIRQFIPILVERKVVDRLTARPAKTESVRV